MYFRVLQQNKQLSSLDKPFRFLKKYNITDKKFYNLEFFLKYKQR